MDKKALAARRKQVVDNNKAQKGKAAAKSKPAKPAAAVKAKPPVARKGKTVEQVRKQWDERIVPSLKRRKSAIEKMPNGVERQNKLIALARRERNAGGALIKKLTELQSGTSKPKPTAPKRTRSTRPAGTVAKPRGMKPGALAARRGVKPFKKVDTSLSGVKARRQRALAPKNSTYLSQKMESRSAIVRSAANAIYNRQRTTGKVLGLAPVVVRQPIGIMPGLSGSNRNRAMANLENARTRVIKGRKGRR